MAKRIILHNWKKVVLEARRKLFHNPKTQEKYKYVQYSCNRCGKVTRKAEDILSACEEHTIVEDLYINK